MASIYATTWEGRRFRPEEYALKKNNLPESPFLPFAASLVQLLLLEFDPPIAEKVPRSPGQKILKAAG